MIELLILYQLTKKVLTMYGISKEIKADFSVLTTPSFGTIKPALLRLEKNGYIRSQKDISAGGRPSVYYSLTNRGKEYLSELLLTPPLENPIQFLPTARVKLYCAEILTNSEQKELLRLLKLKSENIVLDIKNKQASKDLKFHPKMVFDNLICEYKNFILLLEGIERACKD